jgi:hypothetical protein
MSTVLLMLLLVQTETAGKPVVKEIAKETVLYSSAQAFRLCLTASGADAEARLASMKKQGRDLVLELKARRAAEAHLAACKTAEIMRLTIGMSLEVSANAGACGPEIGAEGLPFATKDLLRVRVTSGKDAGAVGCVLPGAVRNSTPF